MVIFNHVAFSNPNHELFDQVLKSHVTNGIVDYSSIKKDSRFYDYLKYLYEADPDALETKNEKIAFWINAYNALAIKGILDGLSPDGFFSRMSYFKIAKHKIAGEMISLYDLEHKMIIPFSEPRIHFAIVCASASCPKLISEAYLAETLDQQLDNSTREFINNKIKNIFDTENKLAKLSKIFDWYKNDFEKEGKNLQHYLAEYIDDDVIKDSLLKKEFRISYLEYDWSLNGTLKN